jgi:hypothetical protein
VYGADSIIFYGLSVIKLGIYLCLTTIEHKCLTLNSSQAFIVVYETS